jgi:acetylornithine deacetylase/succinyl-diaminopimelate desuccinylase-like protein
MSAQRTRVLDAVRPERLGELGLRLCEIRSYTGETREATERFVAEARASGLEVTLFDDYPTTPAVVARLPGHGGGPSLELNAHIDTVPLEHAPAKLAGGTLYGRGATDMKGALAACLEVARALRDAGVRLRGDLLVTTHGLHEAPAGHAEDLVARLRRGVHGDAVIVPELGIDEVPVVGVGLGLFEIDIRRDGEVTHETSTAAGMPHPILAAGRLLTLLEQLGVELAGRPIPRVGTESIFVGEVHGGDFFNRFPLLTRLTGTRRWAPERSHAEAEAELRALCRAVAEQYGLTVELRLETTREGFRIDEAAPIVGILRRVYQELNGRELPLGGTRTVADASIFAREVGVPALYHGPRGRGHHGDEEAMPVAELTRIGRELALVALDFCGTAP